MSFSLGPLCEVASPSSHEITGLTPYLYYISKGLVVIETLIIVNKTQIYIVNTQCETHHTPTHII